jgi:hypothetical protein
MYDAFFDPPNMDDRTADDRGDESLTELRGLGLEEKIKFVPMYKKDKVIRNYIVFR